MFGTYRCVDNRWASDEQLSDTRETIDDKWQVKVVGDSVRSGVRERKIGVYVSGQLAGGSRKCGKGGSEK